MVLVYALLVSIIVAVVSRRRIALSRSAMIIVGLAIVLAGLQYATLDPAGLTLQMLRAAFIVVPSVMLLGMSRVTWLARHAWVFVLIGPVTFVGCYVGLCELCVKTGVI
jgi:hypothetical protein